MDEKKCDTFSTSVVLCATSVFFLVIGGFHTGTKTVFSYIDILFGYKIPDPPILLNFCILTAKYYIYKCKIQLTIPKFESFLQHLRFEYEIEKYIAVQSGKAASFNNRWKILQTWV